MHSVQTKIYLNALLSLKGGLEQVEKKLNMTIKNHKKCGNPTLNGAINRILLVEKHFEIKIGRAHV